MNNKNLGSFKMTQERLEHIRQLKENLLDIPPSVGAPDNWRELLKLDVKAGPWKWQEPIRIKEGRIESNPSAESPSRERWMLVGEITSDSVSNAGRTVTQMFYINPPSEDGSSDQMTDFSQAGIDNLIMAARNGDYELDDEGDMNMKLTFKALENYEVMATISQGRRFDKKNNEWRTSRELVEFHPMGG